MSKKLTIAAALLGATALASAAHAQTADSFVPKTAGTIMVRARVIDVMPQNNGSSVTVIGGKIDATDQPTPELDLSYFVTNNIALELIAATTSHHVSVKNSILGSKVDVGSTSVLPPTVTLQYHFLPNQQFSPYVGAGLNYTFFYNSKPAGALKSLSFQNGFGEAVQVGFDYALTGRWGLNVDVKQLFLPTKASVNGAIHAKTNLDPLVIGAGVSYKF